MRDVAAPPAAALRVEGARVLRFISVGVVNTSIGLSIIAIAQWSFGVRPAVANAWGFAVGILVGYCLNSAVVFRVTAASRGMVARYVVAVGVAFLLNQVVLALLVDRLPTRIGGLIAQSGAIASYTIVLFALCRFWVFARTLPANVARAGAAIKTAGRR